MVMKGQNIGLTGRERRLNRIAATSLIILFLFVLLISAEHGSNSAIATADGDSLTVYSQVDELPTYRGLTLWDRDWHRVFLTDDMMCSMKYADLPEDSIPLSSYIISFIIDSEGKLVSPKVVRVHDQAPCCNEYFRRYCELLTSFQYWTPAKINGNPVNFVVKYRLTF